MASARQRREMRRSQQRLLRRNPGLQFLFDDLFIATKRVVRREWPVFESYNRLCHKGLCAFGVEAFGDPDRWTARSRLKWNSEPYDHLWTLLSPRIATMHALGASFEIVADGDLHDDAFDPYSIDDNPGLWSNSTAIVVAR